MALTNTDSVNGPIGALIAAAERYGDFTASKRSMALLATDLSHILIIDSEQQILKLRPEYVRLGILSDDFTLGQLLEDVMNKTGIDTFTDLNFLEVGDLYDLHQFDANLISPDMLVQASGIVSLVSLLNRNEERILGELFDVNGFMGDITENLQMLMYFFHQSMQSRPNPKDSFGFDVLGYYNKHAKKSLTRKTPQISLAVQIPRWGWTPIVFHKAQGAIDGLLDLIFRAKNTKTRLDLI